MKKRILSLILTCVMLLSITPVVYAASQIDDVFSVTFDNTAPNPGETITAVMSLDRSTADVYRLWSSIYYNKDVLSCEKVEFYGTEIAYEITEDTAGEYDSEVRFDENGRSDDSVAQKIQALPQGPFAKITFKVSSTCDIGQAITGVTTPGKLHNRSFIRLDNISLAYKLPKKFISRWSIEKAIISGSIKNVAVWAKDWKYWDPETGGLAPRTFNIGLTLTL